VELAKNGVVPGGSKSNHKWLNEDIFYEKILPEEQLVLCDAITSGGLLVALNEEDAMSYIEQLQSNGLSHASIIGRVTEKKEKLIYVTR
jgi:selenide,water dikinase